MGEESRGVEGRGGGQWKRGHGRKGNEGRGGGTGQGRRGWGKGGGEGGPLFGSATTEVEAIIN